jgi:hypothetical protein
MSILFLILVLILFISQIVSSIRNILIGYGKITHPMYDNKEKQKYIFHKGVIGLSLTSVALLYIIYLLLQHI